VLAPFPGRRIAAMVSAAGVVVVVIGGMVVMQAASRAARYTPAIDPSPEARAIMPGVEAVQPVDALPAADVH